MMAMREATFGMGCFWEPSESLRKKSGVLATSVGYSGAPPNRPPPLYDTVCFGNDWVEAVRVCYDDEVVSYIELLDHFHECQKPGYKRQYSSVIFVNDDDEAMAARSWKEDRAGRWRSGEQASSSPSSSIAAFSSSSSLSYDNVGIEPSTVFYRAEEYHQRYWEKFRLRVLIGMMLLAGESGAYNDYVGRMLGSTADKMESWFGGELSLEGVCGALFLAGAGWMLLERAIARDVRELKSGDLISSIVTAPRE
jgi:peptide-methionine (S)-S-oxide reductase